MQVYRRITNPYMPQGSASKTNAPTPVYAPGELGCTFSDQNEGRAYLRVLVDSGATSSNPVGVIAVGQAAFWKDRTRAIVTNDPRMCEAPGTSGQGAVNQVVGIFGPTLPTVSPNVNGVDGQPLMYMTDLILEGKAVTMKFNSGGNAVQGANVLLDFANIATANQFITAAAPNTAPVSQIVGISRTTATTPTTILADVKLPFSDGVV